MTSGGSDNKSLGGNVWEILSVNERRVELLMQKYNIPYVIARILVQRNISDDEVLAF